MKNRPRIQAPADVASRGLAASRAVGISLALAASLGIAATLALTAAWPGDVHAQQQLARERAEQQARANAEGIPVPPRSPLASLASSEALEKQAIAQYAQLLQQASAQRALAPDDHPTLQRLRSIAKRLVPHTARFSERAGAWHWEVNLIGSKQVNAFVMPGGKIAFFSGIVDALKLTDDEIAVIMGHEMSHALLEHGRERTGLQRMAQIGTIGASVLSQVLGYGDLGGQLAAGASQLTLLSFSRGDETEADLVGLDIAARAGYDPRAAITLWRKMAALAKSQPPQFLSTHPANATRIDELTRAMPRVMPLYARATGRPLESIEPYRSNWGEPVR